MTLGKAQKISGDAAKTKKPCSSAARAIEPFDKCWGVGASGRVVDPSPFPRINTILSTTEKTTNGECVADRAVIITRAYKEKMAQGLPQILVVAEAMAAYLREIPIEIYENELIVGTLGCKKKAAPVFPEFGLNWVIDEMEKGLLGYSENRTHDYFTHTEETYQKLKELEGFWAGNSVEERLLPRLTEDEIKGSHMGKALFVCNAYIFGGAGHLGVNTDLLYYKGYGGIRKDILAQMDRISKTDPNAARKRDFLRAALTVNEAMSDHIKRYARLAGDRAARETDATRKDELLQIAANCDQIAEGTPTTFYQALNALHFAHSFVQMESTGHSISYGRFDQHLHPFYAKDLGDGTASREFMQELIECFHIKIWEMNKLRDHISINIFSNGGIGGPASTVGGLLPDGRDGTNDLTYMVLDAVAHTRVPTPWTAVRLHANTPYELLVKTANLIRLGLGEPKIFNDDVAIPMMVANGRTLEDARNYQVVGCVEPDASGKEYGWHDAAYFNMNKVLELAINNGSCVDCSPGCARYVHCAGTGKSLGIQTGSLETYESFEDVKQAFDAQMEYWVNNMISLLNKVDIVHQEIKPLPLLSNLMEDCIGNTKDVTAGGALYNYIGPQTVGVGSVGDGLATIKQLVFEEGYVTGRELLDAVKANWVGHEKLYAYVNSSKVHHYGNDDDYADELANFGLTTYCKHVNGKPTAHGGYFQAGAYSVAVNVALGKGQPASVDGRKNYEPVSDCMGAVHTLCCPHDVQGPSAIANSVTKLDHSQAGNGTLLNWKFSPSALEGEVGLQSLIALLKTYVNKKGMHSQFTVASRETLLDAQINPQDYTDLLVRVAGYSAYFVELDKSLQDDIIGRTELSFA
jgi:formate C-acetyltransferase